MEGFNPHEGMTHQQLWNEIFQRSLVPGAQITIEQAGDVVMKSLPLATAETFSTELYPDGRLRIAYREPIEGDLCLLIVPESTRPIANQDFSIVSFINTVAEDYNVAPEEVKIIDQVVTLETYPNSTIEKPPYFFHGSVDADIELFTPHTAPERPNEQAAVYATPDIRIAKQSMANQFVSNGGVLNGTHFICIPMSKEEFEKKDQGGYVYLLPNDEFKENAGQGFGKGEWVATESVAAAGKKYYPSIIAEMKRVGVQIYYIDPTDIALINTLQDGPPEKLQAYFDRK